MYFFRSYGTSWSIFLNFRRSFASSSTTINFSSSCVPVFQIAMMMFQSAPFVCQRWTERCGYNTTPTLKRTNERTNERARRTLSRREREEKTPTGLQRDPILPSASREREKERKKERKERTKNPPSHLIRAVPDLLHELGQATHAAEEFCRHAGGVLLDRSSSFLSFEEK